MFEGFTLFEFGIFLETNLCFKGFRLLEIGTIFRNKPCISKVFQYLKSKDPPETELCFEGFTTFQNIFFHPK